MEGNSGFNANEKAFISGQSELSADYIKEKRELVIEQATGLRNLYEAKKLLEKFESEHTTYDVLTAEEAQKGPENSFQGLIDALEEGRNKVVRIPENDLRNFAEINACVGNLDRAVEIAESIKDDRYGSRAIAEVAKFFIEKGELGDAEILLAKTLPKGSYGGWDDGPLYKIQFKLIEALISSGDEERAIQIVGTLPDKAETSAFLYKAIALHHGKADAIALIKQLDPNEKVAAYSRLADFETERGNKDAAENFIQLAEVEVPHMQFPDRTEYWVKDAKSSTQGRLSEKRNRLEEKQGEQKSEGYHKKFLKAVQSKNLDEALALVKEAEAADYESSLRNYHRYGGNISMRHENDGIADANLQIASLYHEKGDAEKARKYLERAYSWADPFRGAARILKETKNLGYKPLVYKSLRSTFAVLFKKMDAGEEYSTFSPLTNYVGGPLGEKPQALIDIQLELEDFKGALNTYKHFKNRDLFIRILKAQAETAYTQLQAAKAKGIDEVEVAKMLPYALEAHDEQLIEALGGIIPEEEKKQIVDYENISKDDQARLVFGRSMSAGKDDEREYRELQTQAAGLFSEYSKSGDLGEPLIV